MRQNEEKPQKTALKPSNPPYLVYVHCIPNGTDTGHETRPRSPI